MKRKTILTIPLAILATLAVAGAADAHDGVASGTCNGGVTWDYHNYDKAVVNSITVTIDGTVRYTDPNFKASDVAAIATDKTQPHTWDVNVNAPGTQFDKHPSGAYGACVVVPTTVASSTTVVVNTTAPPPSTAPAVATTVVTGPTTSAVEIITPPVPCPYNPTVPADSPLCVPPTTPSTPSDVLVLTPAEPVLPATGGGDTVLIVGGICFVLGLAFLGVRGRRVR